MNWDFLNIPVGSWITAASTLVVIAAGVPIVQRFLRKWHVTDHAIDGTWRGLAARLNKEWMFLTTLTIALVSAVFILQPDDRIARVSKWILVVIISIQFARLVPEILDWIIGRVTTSHSVHESFRSTAETLRGMRWLVVLSVYAIIALLALQNLGIEVTPLIAGLGIGGIAIALAIQSILGDLFASLTIALDKPFVIGDFIVVGDEMGTVEHVGLKTTRVRSLSGEQLVFGNSDLLSSRIRNYKRMAERRVLFRLGVVYETTPEVLEQIPIIIRSAIESRDNTRFDRCHFFQFGASSLDFESVYYIKSPDYNAHMDALQATLLTIAKAFRDRGIEIAFPTQTLHITSMPMNSTDRSHLQPSGK